MMRDAYDLRDRLDGDRAWDAWLARQLAVAMGWLGRLSGIARKPLSSDGRGGLTGA